MIMLHVLLQVVCLCFSGVFNVGNKLLVTLDLFFKMRHQIRLGDEPAHAALSLIKHSQMLTGASSSSSSLTHWTRVCVWSWPCSLCLVQTVCWARSRSHMFRICCAAATGRLSVWRFETTTTWSVVCVASHPNWRSHNATPTTLYCSNTWR